MRPICIKRNFGVGGPEIKVMPAREYSFEDFDILKMWRKEPFEVLHILEFVLVLVNVFCPAPFFYERMSRQNSIFRQSFFKITHYRNDLLRREMLDRSVPDNILVLTSRHMSSYVCKNILYVRRIVFRFCSAQSQRIEIASNDFLGAVRVKVSGIKAISAGEL